MRIISNNKSVNVTELFINLKINGNKQKLQEEVALLKKNPPPKPISPPEAPCEPMSLNELNNNEMSYGSGTTSAEEYREKYQQPYDNDMKLYIEALEKYNAREDVRVFQHYQQDLQQKQNNLQLLTLNITNSNIILDSVDMQITGALTDAAIKKLEQLQLSRADILEIEQSSQAAKQLTELCNQYLENPYLIDTERAFIITCRNQINTRGTPVVSAVQSFHTTIQAAKEMPIGKLEHIALFIIKCVDVIIALFSKNVSAKEAFAAVNKTQTERLHDFKDRFQKVVGQSPKDKAELSFMKKFEAAYQSPEMIDDMVSRRHVVKDKNYTLSQLEKDGYFDQDGNLKQPLPHNDVLDMIRINAELGEFSTNAACKTDKEKIIIASVIFVINNEVAEDFHKERQILMQKIDAEDNPDKQDSLNLQHMVLTNISEHSDKIAPFIHKQLNAVAEKTEKKNIDATSMVQL